MRSIALDYLTTLLCVMGTYSRRLRYLALVYTLLVGSTVGVLLAQSEPLRIVSYNVENLLDTIDNEHTADDEFTPEGRKHWDSIRYYRKLRHIATVISRIGRERWPSIVALIEVENAQVIEELLHRTPLRTAGYSYVITSGNDPRGIEVALLYRPTQIRLVRWAEHPIAFTDPSKRSRSLLHCALELPDGISLHCLVAHLPSRRGGALHSERYRREGALRLRELSDSLYLAHGASLPLIIMGDFNGSPHEPPTRIDLGAHLSPPALVDSLPADGLHLYNLTSPRYLPAPKHYGTYRYRGIWSQLDQFILSASLLNPQARLRYVDGSVEVYAPEWLQDSKGNSNPRAPWRTYLGDYYSGGYSDHYPITLELEQVVP